VTRIPICWIGLGGALRRLLHWAASAGGIGLHIHALMMNAETFERKWTERPSAAPERLWQGEFMFKSLFDKSADAIWLFDPAAGVFVDCNNAAIELMGAGTKERLLHARPEDLSPPAQPDGTGSREKAAEMAMLSAKHGAYRFEWLARRLDGQEVPLEVLSTQIPRPEGNLYVIVSRDISERKKAEGEIRELNQSLEARINQRTAELADSEARFRALVEHAPEAIVVIDGATGRFLFGNAHACRLYGVEPDELTQLAPADVSPELQACGRPSRELAREKMQEALAGGMPVFEWVHRRPGGRLVPTEVRLLRLPCEAGTLLRASIIDRTEDKRREQINRAARDISEAVHTAEDLDAFYRHLHQVVGGLMPAKNFYIALLDSEIEMIRFAYHVDERTPHPAPRPMNTGLTSLVLRTGKALLIGREMEERKRQVEGGVTFEGLNGATYVECGDPAAIWLGVPLLHKGKAVGVVAVQDYQNQDAYGEQDKQILTFVAGQIALALERKRVAEALRKSEENFRALFEASSQGAMLHDEKQYLEVNSAAVRMLGYSSAEELRGKHPSDTSPPFQSNGESSAVLAVKYINQCLREGHARFEWTGLTAQGRQIPLEVTLTRIDWSGRQIIQAFVSDITERKQAEEELLKTLAREKELGQLKSTFVSMVSHEFRTPLAIIQSSVEILRDYLDRLQPKERAEQLESILKNTRRMAEMMEKILVLSRLDAGKMDFKPAPIDLAVFCRRLVEEIHFSTESRCPIKLALAGQTLLGQADEALLGHIFTNLLCNAVKYSEPGSPVEFTVERDGREVCCVITDRGIGIAPADQPSIFKAFQRGGNVGDRPGTGLGLMLVKRCVELHGGKVEIESQLGAGTTVRVHLPVFGV
jgi:PAS domain S-box-containing protein